MKLSNLIDRLLEIQNEYDCDDVDVFVMEEHEVDSVTMQFESKITDVAASIKYKGAEKSGKCSRIIIIGQEID